MAKTKNVAKRILKSAPRLAVRAIILYKGMYILVVKGGKAYVSSTAYKRITPIKEIPPFKNVSAAKRSISIRGTKK